MGINNKIDMNRIKDPKSRGGDYKSAPAALNKID